VFDVDGEYVHGVQGVNFAGAAGRSAGAGELAVGVQVGVHEIVVLVDAASSVPDARSIASSWPSQACFFFVHPTFG
jgi:hypothetical protein